MPGFREVNRMSAASTPEIQDRLAGKGLIRLHEILKTRERLLEYTAFTLVDLVPGLAVTVHLQSTPIEVG
jgi:hypothetical protein